MLARVGSSPTEGKDFFPNVREIMGLAVPSVERLESADSWKLFPSQNLSKI